RRVLRPRSRPQRPPAIGTHRSTDWPAGDPGTAGALSAHRAGWRTALEPAGRDHRQPRRSGLRSTRPAAARPHRLLSLPRAPTRPAARWTATRASRRGPTRTGIHTRTDAEARFRARAG